MGDMFNSFVERVKAEYAKEIFPVLQKRWNGMPKEERKNLSLGLEETMDDAQQSDANADTAKAQASTSVANPTVWSERLGKNSVKTGSFGEYMDVMIRNDGPCTILVDSEEAVPRSTAAPSGEAAGYDKAKEVTDEKA